MPSSRSGAASTRRITHTTGRFTRSTEGSRSLERGLLLLRAFRVGTSTLSNADLAERSGLPRPTVSRLARSLVDAGFLRYDVGERAYRLAPVLLCLAHAFRHSTPVLEIASPLMQQVAMTERINVSLATVDQTDMVYLASFRLSGDEVSTTRRVESGTRAPIERTTIGLACLSALPQAERAELLNRIAERNGARWATRQRQINEEIARAARRGYCSSTYPARFLSAVGAAFLGPDGQYYGVSISFPRRGHESRSVSGHYGSMLLRLVAEMTSSWEGPGDAG